MISLYLLYSLRHQSRQTYNNPLLNDSSASRFWQEWDHGADQSNNPDLRGPSISPSLVSVQTELNQLTREEKAELGLQVSHVDMLMCSHIQSVFET